MRALTLVADRQLVVADVPTPAPSAAGEVPLDDVATALKRMESRQVFGTIVVYF